jgi:O-acetyl-ADP-ribose deacetylase (regulator of RNase III)
MNVIFVSLNQKWIDSIKPLFPDSEAICGDVQTIPREQTTFVSPANCLGFMDGGIDLVYSRKMFLGCEQTVRQTIREIGLQTLLGRPYLPIGSALGIPVGETTSLICAPTMFLPHDVSETRNAYHACLAALLCWKKMKSDTTLVFTSHCCGYGKMNEEESAKQMRDAYDDFSSGRVPEDSSQRSDTVLLPLVNDEQPNNYDNREIKDVSLIHFMKNLPVKTVYLH